MLIHYKNDKSLFFPHGHFHWFPATDQATSGGIPIYTNGQPIDREEFPEFDIVFMIAEVNTPEQLTGTSTLTITVLDENDNPHIGITKHILVYSYEGKFQQGAISEDVC